MRSVRLLFAVLILSTSANAESLLDEVAQIGNQFFLREQAVDLLFSGHGDLGRSFPCTGGLNFVVNDPGRYNGICTYDTEVYSVEATTWPGTSELQAVMVCNHAVTNPDHHIPIQTLRSSEVESSEWSVDGQTVGRVRYLGRTGGWFADTYDNVLFDGNLSGIQALCWWVKKPRQ